jgi:HNH endonuclease
MTESTLPEVWHRDHPRTRMVVLHLWDGRCGHCGAPLLSSNESEFEPDGFRGAPFQVDHIKPSSHGGPHAIANYIAACDACNRRRSNGLITDAAIHSTIEFVRNFIASEEFPSYVEGVSEIDSAIEDRAYFSMVRCFVHDWHVLGSPFQVQCFNKCQRHFPGILGLEWWSRFGLLSHSVRQIVGENLHIRGVVRGYDWWQQPDGWDLMLPRYCRSPFDIAEVLSAVDTIGDRPRTEPAPECFFGAVHGLSIGNQRRALSRSLSCSVDELLRLDCYIDYGVTSKALVLLWRRKRWPTHLLFDYPASVQTIQLRGELRRRMGELQKLTTRQQAEDYLQQIA